ncbi:protein kinase [Kitasatospora sp. NPDC051914]|uniref:serine/threonine-protein kinase n=1 Tax=Kitasatospora sp. NPDC051914 TaxID=3154945 RepID=UPI003448BA4B
MRAGGLLAGRYTLVEPLAAGAQGTVWRAVDRENGTDVAVKVIGASDVGALLRLVCEQSVRLGHPHVLAPLDWFVRDGEAWLVLPLVRGGTLAGLLADYGELPPQVGLLLAEQVLDALVAVHTAGLVHRDVKPSNLLLAATGTGRPHLYLADFGVVQCRPHLRLTEHRLVVGTPDYLSPEVRGGEGSSPAQDVYAAGLVLAALGAPREVVAAMTADRPEQRPTAATALEAIASARAALGPESWPVVWWGEEFGVLDQLAEAAGPAVHAGAQRDDGPVSYEGGQTGGAPGARSVAGTTGRSKRQGGLVRWVVAAVVLLAAAAGGVVALEHGADDGPVGASGSTRPSGTTAPSRPGSQPTAAGRSPRAVPSDADIAVPDPDGPTAFSPCEAAQQYRVRFSPEGYLLVCEHLPGSRDYEWTPQRED